MNKFNTIKKNYTIFSEGHLCHVDLHQNQVPFMVESNMMLFSLSLPINFLRLLSYFEKCI